MKAKWRAVLLLVMSVAVAQTAENRPGATTLFTLAADYDTIGDAVGEIRGPAVRVCFESRDFARELDEGSRANRISRADRIAELEGVAGKRKLSAREAELLGRARQEVRDGQSPDVPFDLKFDRISGKFACATVDELLAELTRDSPYTWEKCGKSYVVSPKTGSVLAFPVTLHVRREQLGSVIGRILAQSPGDPVGLGSFGIGPGPLPEPEKRMVESLQLEGTPCRAALCQAVESVGDDVVWDLAGLKHARTLFLRVIRSQKAEPSAGADPAGARPAQP